MIFSSKAEYGVRLMVELGRQTPDQPTSLKAIADAEGLPLAYLEQVVARLRRADLVMSARGAHGGYWLARDPAEITMYDVVGALEGPIAPMECFVHDQMERIVCSHLPQETQRPVRHQAAVDASPGRDHPLAADDDARGTRRVLPQARASASNPRRELRPAGASDRAHLSGRARRDGTQLEKQRLNPERQMPDLEIRNLHVRAGDNEILRGVDLAVGGGEIHALMGPNGSGKSTLANVIMGHPSLEVTEGEILWGGENITEADTDERARMGLFMAFQYPVAVPGVTVTKYLRTVLNAHRTAKGEEPISLKDFRQNVQAAMELTKVPEEFTRRYLNDGFSGGEKKKLEILQLAVQKPSLAILDETDSGLDIDALRTVAEGVNTVAGQQGSDLGVLIITHYQRILHLVQPSHVHVLYRGRIVKQGGPELVGELEAKGYGWITDEVDAATV